MTDQRTQKQIDKDYKKKYKARGKELREKKAKANEPKYNEQGQKRVEGFGRVNP